MAKINQIRRLIAIIGKLNGSKRYVPAGELERT